MIQDLPAGQTNPGTGGMGSGVGMQEEYSEAQ